VRAIILAMEGQVRRNDPVGDVSEGAVLQAGYKVVQFLPLTGNDGLEASKRIIAGG